MTDQILDVDLLVFESGSSAESLDKMEENRNTIAGMKDEMDKARESLAEAKN